MISFNIFCEYNDNSHGNDNCVFWTSAWAVFTEVISSALSKTTPEFILWASTEVNVKLELKCDHAFTAWREVCFAHLISRIQFHLNPSQTLASTSYCSRVQQWLEWAAEPKSTSFQPWLQGRKMDIGQIKAFQDWCMFSVNLTSGARQGLLENNGYFICPSKKHFAVPASMTPNW